MTKTYRLVTYHDSRKAEILQLEESEYPRGWSSISTGYPTIEELYEKVPLAPSPCSICGSPYSVAYTNKKELIEHGLCFNCNFWRDKIQNWEPTYVCVDGHLYSLLTGNPAESRMLGHGGSEFFVQRRGEKQIRLFNNVWHAGEVPPHFRDKIKDDADFVPAPFRLQYRMPKSDKWLDGKGFLTAELARKAIKEGEADFRVVDSQGNEVAHEPKEDDSDFWG